MDDKPRRRFRFGLISLFALIAVVGIVACFWNPLGKPIRNDFHLIKPGMTIAEVAALVGPPDIANSHSDPASGRFGVGVTHSYQVIADNEAYLVFFLDGQVAFVRRFPDSAGDAWGGRLSPW